MNNRYIFRGKREDNGEWIYGNFCCGNERQTLHDSIFVYDCETQSFDNYDIIPETVGQCIGLEDKNGKWIFEGDVVKACDETYDNGFEEVKGKVFFNCGSFDIDDDVGYIPLYAYGTENVEVIGNIHDDKNLLEVEK